MGVLTKHPYFYAYVTHKDSTYAIKYKERPRKHSRDGGSRSLGGPYIKKAYFPNLQRFPIDLYI